jgi:23S rRNA (uracil1939-C5)-methyltransferase
VADEQISLTLERLAYGGDAVGRSGGKVVFAAYGLPGEQVRVALSKQRKNFARGRVVEVLADPSPQRVPPRCEYFGECGGCQWQHLDYPAQAVAKGELLAEQLRRIGGINIAPLPTIAAPDPWAYRNVTRLQVSYPLEGAPRLGYFRRESHSIVPIARCYIVHPRIVELLEPLNWLVNTLPRAALSAITVRAAFADDATYLLLHQGNVRVNLGDVRRILPAWIKQERLIERFNLRGIATVSPPPPLKRTANAPQPGDVGGEMGELVADEAATSSVLWGDPLFSESVGDTRYRFPATTFFQVNTAATYALAELVREAVSQPLGERQFAPTEVQVQGGPASTLMSPTQHSALSTQHSMLDLYSGVGLFSLHLLAAGAVSHAVGIEVQSEAVKAARANAEAQGHIPAAEFYAGRIEETLPELLAEGLTANVVVADPPRAGLSPAVIELIITLNPQRIVYVSCDPSILARDLKAFASHFQLRSTQAIDLFPQTYHIESVSVLERLGEP